VTALARDQRAAHTQRAVAYERMQGAATAARLTPAQLATLELGRRMEWTIAQFWEELLADREREA
jgi:hypothetical protein